MISSTRLNKRVDASCFFKFGFVFFCSCAFNLACLLSIKEGSLLGEGCEVGEGGENGAITCPPVGIPIFEKFVCAMEERELSIGVPLGNSISKFSQLPCCFFAAFIESIFWFLDKLPRRVSPKFLILSLLVFPGKTKRLIRILSELRVIFAILLRIFGNTTPEDTFF